MMRAVIQSSGPPPLTSAPSHSLFSQVSLMQVLNDLKMTSIWPWMTFHVNVEIWPLLSRLKSNFRQTEVKSFSQWIWTVVWKLDSKFGQNVKCVGVSIIYVGDSNYLQKLHSVIVNITTCPLISKKVSPLLPIARQKIIVTSSCHVMYDEVIVTSSMMTHNYDDFILVRTQVQTRPKGRPNTSITVHPHLNDS